MRDLFYKLARHLRPFQSLAIPNNLAFPEMNASLFEEQAMMRDAHFSQSWNAPRGIFEVVGLEHAARAERAWRPRELFLMLAVNTSFEIVTQQCRQGILVEPRDRDRLIEVLKLYFEYLRVRKVANEVRDSVEAYIAAHTLADAMTAAEAAQPIVIRHSLLAELHQVDDELRERFPSPQLWDEGLIALGLGVADQERIQNDEGRYDWCTPINCRAFGWTGGDGVHFSLMLRGREITADSPVVMTLPANCGESMIVGENMFDFLCLGLRHGYFALEQLSYKPEEALDAYTNSAWRPTTDEHGNVGFFVSEHHQRLLDYLAERLHLQPWTDRNRLAMLQDKYKSQLQLPPDMLM